MQSRHLLRRDRWPLWRVTLQDLAVRGPDTELTPDLLYAAAAQREYPARQIPAQVRPQLRAFPYQSLVGELQQFGRQPSLQSHDRFRTAAKAVVGRKQLAGY
jgi:hypothetical protein